MESNVSPLIMTPAVSQPILLSLRTVMMMVLGVGSLGTSPVSGYSSGAPNSVCSSMTPGHGSQSSASSPYTISLGGVTTYKAGDTISVTISGSFMGLMMQMRQVGSTSRYGTWSNLAANTRTQTCSNTADTVTHSSSTTKVNPTFTWTAPDSTTADLQVVATVAQQKTVWWTSLTSNTITYSTGATAAPTTTTTTVVSNSATNSSASTTAETLSTTASSSGNVPDTTVGSSGSDISLSFRTIAPMNLILFLAAIVTQLLL